MSEYEKSLDLFVEYADEDHTSNTYTALYTHKKNFMSVLGTYACHGNLPGRICGVDEVFVNINKNIVKKQLALDFIDFWVNRSPVAQIFIEKDAQKIYRRCATVSLSYPSNLVGFGLIGLRACYEKYNDEIKYRIVVFDKLKQLGFSEWEAYLFSFMIKRESENSYRFQTFNSDHCVVPGLISKIWLRNALAKKFVNIHRINANDANSVVQGGVQAIFGDPFKQPLNVQIQKITPKSKKVAKNWNPFKLLKEQETGYIFIGDEELVDLVTEIKELAA